MNKIITILGFCAALLCSCGKDEPSAEEAKSSEIIENVQPEKINKIENISQTFSSDLLLQVKKNPQDFEKIFSDFDDAQKYYFCAAFTMGAMSVSKPITASAMVNYFLGIGVLKYNRGIDDNTYKTFDFGKNIFRFEPVVNTILQKQICEKIVGDATEFAKKQKIETKKINDKGKIEVHKIVKYIKNK